MGCLQLVVPEGTTDWRCACKGVPDMHLAFVLTKFSQFRGQKQIHFILVSMCLARKYSLGTLFFTSLTGDGTTILRSHPSNAKV